MTQDNVDYAAPIDVIAAKLPTKLNREWAQEIIDALAAAGFALVNGDTVKVSICEYMLEVNRGFVEASGHPLIPPTAINWLGDGMVTAVGVGAVNAPHSDE